MIFEFPAGFSIVSGKKASATEKVIVLGAQMELEARSLHISHLRELYHRVESSGTSPDSVSGSPNRADAFFPLYAIYVPSIWWIRCVPYLYIVTITL